MVFITSLEKDVHEKVLQGKQTMQIAEELNKDPSTIRKTFQLLIRKGFVERKGFREFAPSGKIIEYEVDERANRENEKGSKQRKKTPVQKDVLDYIRGHYPFYRHRRGELAKRLGMSRTTLNQILIEYGIAKGKDVEDWTLTS